MTLYYHVDRPCYICHDNFYAVCDLCFGPVCANHNHSSPGRICPQTHCSNCYNRAVWGDGHRAPAAKTTPTRTPTVKSNIFTAILRFLIGLLGIRFGEADHPGPVSIMTAEHRPLSIMHPCVGMNSWGHAFPQDTLKWACDIDANSSLIILDQYKLQIHGDLHRITKSQVPDYPIDIYTIGTDCRAWSIFGRMKGVTDDRAKAYWEHWNLIEMMEEYNRPRIVITEQSSEVEHSIANVWATDRAKRLGYVSKSYQLDSRRLGSIQSRKRLYVVHVRNDVYVRSGHIDPGPIYPVGRITSTV